VAGQRHTRRNLFLVIPSAARDLTPLRIVERVRHEIPRKLGMTESWRAALIGTVVAVASR
jgi:hypothetical protein